MLMAVAISKIRSMFGIQQSTNVHHVIRYRKILEVIASDMSTSVAIS